ncbi:MAG: bifunctional adenosylcobinamide kinase/adenosylcobinamide-phosphate guanylyltransferase [Clostridiales bacterium]|jgi:adenosylcobinamide kinase/adenosylcobinamide-phosphate guanylyltransferase|nr:bifunctional adenosylcobinamide kinase/adenosylcobinamide-phosphate guanylyltransferase [Clostridiales bacterium]
MNALILGANGSGKSVYAEKYISRFSRGALYYAATMIPYGKEGIARIEAHRAQRAALEFITVEKPFCVSEIPFTPGASVLLEDVSNLLANALFENDGNGGNGFSKFEKDGNGGNGFSEIDECVYSGIFGNANSSIAGDVYSKIAEVIFLDITAMCGKCANAVLVSINGLTAMPEYDEETRRFIYELNKLNARLFEYADVVISMRGGEAFIEKGNLPHGNIF